MTEPLLAAAPPRLRFCAGCRHRHGGRAYGVCLVSGCACVAVVERQIDYLVESEDVRAALPAREKIELDQGIFGGERSAQQLAEDFGATERTVQRRRAELRARGYRIPVPEPEFDESRLEGLRQKFRRLAERQRRAR